MWLLVVAVSAVVAVRAIGAGDVAGATVPESATAGSATPSPAAAAGFAVSRHRHQDGKTQAAPRRTGRTAGAATPHWHRVLDRLSRMRAAAWRHGRPGQLRSVYAPAAHELTRDQTMLRHYTDRNLRVQGARLMFERVRLVRRGPHFVVLRAIDQLAPTVAVDRHGERLRLPRDEPTRHIIELRRTSAGWRIASVLAE